jgi:hypothetical protein
VDGTGTSFFRNIRHKCVRKEASTELKINGVVRRTDLEHIPYESAFSIKILFLKHFDINRNNLNLSQLSNFYWDKKDFLGDHNAKDI